MGKNRNSKKGADGIKRGNDDRGNNHKGIPKKTHRQPQPPKAGIQARQTAQKQVQQMKMKRESAAINAGSASSANANGGRPLSALQQKFQKKLEGARFRVINEKLYTTTGANAFEEFQRDPSLFTIYHQGFREQAAQWPYNPLDRIIDFIKLKTNKTKVVADIGCGDARLSQSVPNKVYSFDLVSPKDSEVIACDMAHLPLPDASVDIAVFCLALMGSNIPDFIKEAHRVLRRNGIIKIAEVRSRFEESGSNGIKHFVKFLKRAGFDVSPGSDRDNKMFFEMECIKTDREPVFAEELAVKACVYKKR